MQSGTLTAGSCQLPLPCLPPDVPASLADMLHLLPGLQFAKNVDPTPPTPGYLTLEITHPHDPGWKLLQVCCRFSAACGSAQLVHKYSSSRGRLALQ